MPWTPLFTPDPNRKIGCAAPWSVPPLQFSCTRRPNSLKV
jgi:hypothetical protein